MNLAKCMKDKTLKSETELFEILMENGLYLVPGQAFENKENGWFRMIISNESAVLTTALQRLQKVVQLESFTRSMRSTKRKNVDRDL